MGGRRVKRLLGMKWSLIAGFQLLGLEYLPWGVGQIAGHGRNIFVFLMAPGISLEEIVSALEKPEERRFQTAGDRAKLAILGTCRRHDGFLICGPGSGLSLGPTI